MPENRDQLVGELSARLQAFGEAADPAPLLDAAVPGLLRDLAETLWSPTYVDVTPDVARAMTALVGVHWLRYQFLPDGQDQDDLQWCLRWSRILLTVAPDFVPEEVRDYLGRS